MADNKTLEQMLEHLVNDEQDKAEELFHEYVVAKSREIYEELIESEIEEDSKDEEVEEATEESKEDEVEEATEEKDEDAVEEATEESDEEVEESTDEDETNENFEDIPVEADEMGGDPTDDLEAELDAEEGEEEGEKDEEELFQDLEQIVDELQAKFDELKGHEAEEGEEEAEEMFAPESAEEELETVREYVEKAPAPVTSEQGADTKSTVAGKNDMGGTSANIAKGADEKGRPAPTAKEHDGGNVNVPGAKNATKMSNEKGAGKETAADNKDSLFRG